MSQDSNDKKEPRKVIDMTERLPTRNPMDKFKSLKVRLDLEQAKVAIPVSLLSILTVVTLANSKLLDSPDPVQSRELASEGTLIQPSRGIASVPTGTSENEDQLVREMAAKTLSDVSSVGRKPSALEKLTIETLEGKYAVLMTDESKISEIQISESQSANPVAFSGDFIESNRQFMPSFDKSIRVQNAALETGSKQQYHLVNEISMPVAKVDVTLDTEGRLLGLKVVPTSVAESK